MEKEPLIRPATPEDAEKAAEIERVCLSRPWSAAQLRDSQKRADYRLLLAEINGETVGTVDFVLTGDYAEICNLAVLPAYRRRGIASALVRRVGEIAKEEGGASITLEVSEQNTQARAFYAALGFSAEGRRPGFYGEEAALILWKRFGTVADRRSEGKV